MDPGNLTMQYLKTVRVWLVRNEVNIPSMTVFHPMINKHHLCTKLSLKDFTPFSVRERREDLRPADSRPEHKTSDLRSTDF